MCGGEPVSVTDALTMLDHALDSLNGTDVAAPPADTQALVLRALERVEAKHTAARARVLTAFAAQDGYQADGHGAARTSPGRSGSPARDVRPGVAAAAGGLPVGPLVVAALITASRPAAALACSAVLVGAGTVSFVAATAGGPRARCAVTGGCMAPGVSRRCGSWRSAQRQGLTFGALPAGLAAVTAAAALPSLAGVLLATLTIGGIIGTFGPVTTAGKRRYVRLSAGFAAALIPVVVLSIEPSAKTLIVIGAALTGAGLFVTPIAATSYA